jgi:hypothetical protein
MRRMLEARWMVLLAGSLGGVGCYPGGAAIPGDARRFDPVGALPQVIAFAGPDAMLIDFGADDVRKDGTVDFSASYVKDEEGARYSFARPAAASTPVGTRHRFDQFTVWVRRPSYRNERGVLYVWRRGMALEDPSQTDQDLEAVPPPRCTFGQLWALAKERGAPEDAVAYIGYHSGGYDFVIRGTPFKVNFDADCKVKN